mmetsp:Transcript_83035/g.221859  ORF Transcript_83035/g.221859 Transcript_83035/m.221859 type:complete len:200 (+) Transcript_83035:69-668(+)
MLAGLPTALARATRLIHCVGGLVGERLGTGVDSGDHGVGVDQTVLDFVQNHSRNLDKDFLDTLPSQSAGFQKQHIILLCASRCFQKSDSPLVLQVTLVADSHDRNICSRQSASVSQPIDKMVVRLTVGDVVHDQRPSCTPVITPGDRAIPFLTSRIPDLQLDVATTDPNDLGAELDSNGVGRTFLKFVLNKLMQQARLP